MTTPNGPSNFEYSDDSVVARLSFDVPPQALTDVTQLTQALSAMATQQEYIARSTGSWLDYMQQVPQIMERANQAYRESITQLERMSYIQNEMGGMPGGNVSPGAAGGPQGGGYSTAAPAGYTNPFAGQFFGMGMTPDLMGAQQQLGMMASQDPRLYANMMAARGQAVNPALMGMMGGTIAGATGQGGIGGTGGGQGWGAAAPGSTSSQATQANRDSAAPPDPTQSGATTTSEPQRIPATPHPDAPAWQQAAAGGINSAQQVVNEAQSSGGRGSKLLGLASAGLGGASMLMNKIGQGEGSGFGRLGGVAKGVGVAAGIGGAAYGFNKVQDFGEAIQKQQQLGAVQGGDFGTGIGYEAQARMLALNPFITTEQARSAMQMALSQGFKGGEYDTVMDYMLSNFKEMGVQFSTSKDLIMQGIYSGDKSVGQAGAESADFLKAMYELSANGGAAFPQRQQQGLEMRQQLIGQGVSAESASRSALGFQEGYSENQLLRDKLGGVAQGAMGNENYLAQIGYQNGVTGILPSAIPKALEQKGIDQDEAFNEASKKYAYMAQQQWPNNMLNAVATFQGLMAQMGAEMDYNTAEEQYKKVLGIDGAKDPTQQANENVNRGRKEQTFGSKAGDFWQGISRPFTTGALGALANATQLRFGEAWDDLTTNPFASRPDPSQGERNNFAAAGRTPSEPPKTPREAFQGPLRTEGQVSGNVTITVDQNGKVTAPQSIQLSGQQKSANSGYGSAQLNNAPPGDPSFHNAYSGWGGTG